MCRCTPTIRSPFCGRPGCEWPPQPDAERDPDIARTIETRELIATVRRVAKEQPLYRPETILHLNLAAAELERMAYPSQSDPSVKP